MLKTVLLLDGSEAVNCSLDYLPTRLIALRPQLNKFVHTYLDANPLASLGVVVMRDGVAQRLIPCTTNATDIVQTLELKYFRFGGSGAMSLENGLRMALSELVDLRRIAKRLRENNSGSTGSDVQEDVTSRLRIVLASSSVTIVDPLDVFAVQKIVAQLRVRVDVISFCGAVHVLQEAAVLTGGSLHTPMNYEHLTEILRHLASPEGGSARHVGVQPALIQIGFPMYVGDEAEGKRYLTCPQCGLIQTSIPSTCPLCKLLLFSVPLIHVTFITRNELCAPSQKVEHATKKKTTAAAGGAADTARCSLCQRKLAGEDGGGYWCCGCCLCERCEACETYIRENLGLCPTCVATS
ncbi:DNA repair and transcription factor protein,putative [Trypanosoma brucei gambiense DAL972]|uniref:DNA repair and transcription factor protein,putative n=2 Tax=Trypanosoma brucei TaxID=5691 RepID=C9ZWD7_TRYB9|nr:DNA repair and transcription factor protein,putative [Trypanosoma brucei gambiense DAL972]RHW73123.1 TFIIH basal transcription factor subunit [Trypanosoma brucei equiperdum]CBH13726.1 DNA repair and transcription factor protein,putative [Trypanosoma brucei gambiense DAL972]|eukprot:XP_011776002.1 DNA repair and transcription factor protein,putative [Trypanosoma brucei gambiense DAL972]